MPAVIEGVVADSAGRGIGHASVYVVSAPVEMPDVAARTDENGRFRLSAPAPGDYRLAATAAGFTTASVPVTVDAASEAAAIAITLQPADAP